MTRYPEIKQLTALAAYKSDGTFVPVVLDPTNGVGLTLAAATYLFPFGGERYGSMVETVMHALSAKWPSGIVGSITIEGTNFPKTITGADQGAPDITDWDTSAAWQQIDITLAGMVYAVASGTGAMTKFTCAITAGAGGAAWNIPDLGFMRLRAKAVLSTGGFLRMGSHAKLGS
jgi:hypothetical protein